MQEHEKGNGEADWYLYIYTLQKIINQFVVQPHSPMLSIELNFVFRHFLFIPRMLNIIGLTQHAVRYFFFISSHDLI